MNSRMILSDDSPAAIRARRLQHTIGVATIFTGDVEGVLVPVLTVYNATLLITGQPSAQLAPRNQTNTTCTLYFDAAEMHEPLRSLALLSRYRNKLYIQNSDDYSWTLHSVDTSDHRFMDDTSIHEGPTTWPCDFSGHFNSFGHAAANKRASAKLPLRFSLTECYHNCHDQDI